ncbi:MAG: DHH family phosphoesterase [Lachnospiraceae bacterium]|nr:DHH family phosphoesterase [Lachnospiraceae bacterium]
MLDIERNNAHTFEELVELVRGKNVYIQTHNYPDPDAIGAGYGLQKLFESNGIDAKLCYHGKIDRLNTKKMVELLKIKIYSKDELEEEMGEDDPIICIDSQKNGGNIMDLVGDEIAAIDHHPTVDEVDYYYKDVRIVGACASIVADLFVKNDVPMDEYTATALLYGLKMDTNGFSRGVTDFDIEAFRYLYRRANKSILSQLEQNQMEFSDLKAYGAAIENIKIFEKIGFANIPFSCQDALIAITCDFILSLEEVDLAVVYSKRDDGFKFSVRCENFLKDVDCGKLIAVALDGIGNGGGHAFMAGGFLPKDAVETLGDNCDEAIIERFLKAYEDR